MVYRLDNNNLRVIRHQDKMLDPQSDATLVQWVLVPVWRMKEPLFLSIMVGCYPLPGCLRTQ